MALKSTSLTTRQAASPAQAGKLSPLDIAHVAYSAGFRGDRLTMAVAISLAESGGDPKAKSGTDDHGLWQINRHWHPTYFTQAGRIYDPAYNGAAAFAISNGGTNWGPWSTYQDGSYKHYLGQGIPHGPGADKIIGAGAGKQNTGGGWIPGLPDPGDIGNPIKWVDEAAKNIVAFLKIMVDPERLGRHIANMLVWLLRQLAKGVYNVIILPPWRWTQRATLYYWENNVIADSVVGGKRYGMSVKAIATIGFWATGYAILWGRFEPVENRVAPGESAFASTIASGRNAAVARKITKPKDVEKKTAVKPEATATTIPVGIVRTVAATRKRTVKVSGSNERNTTEGTSPQSGAENVGEEAQPAQDTATE